MANSTRKCYFPSGNESTDVPCSSDKVTGCCSSKDICLSNGLCLNASHQPYVLSRGSCTNQNWGEGCPIWCRDNNPTGGCSIINLALKNGVSTYCCGTPISNGTKVICPNGADSFLIPTAQVVPGAALLSNVTSFTETTPSSSPSSSPSAQTETAQTCHDTAIGAGVGVPLGVIALMALAWALFERRARQAMEKQVATVAIPGLWYAACRGAPATKRVTANQPSG